MLSTIKLYGHLGKRFGRTWQFDIDHVYEVIRALECNVIGFRNYLIEHSSPGYRVLIDDNPIMDLDELGMVVTIERVIKIVPVVQGAGDGKAIGQIILGVGLIALAFVPGVGTALSAGLGSLGIEATAGMMSLQIGLIGFGMLAGGAMQLLSPTPTAVRNAKQANNPTFSGGLSIIQQGQRVPLCYGRYLVEGLPISAKLVIENE